MSGKTGEHIEFEAVNKSAGATLEVSEEMKKQIEVFLRASGNLANTWKGSSRDKFVQIYPEIAEAWKNCMLSIESLAQSIQAESNSGFERMQLVNEILKIKR